MVISKFARRRITALAVIALGPLTLTLALRHTASDRPAAPAAAAAPPIPGRVALQVGHWRHDELPDELSAVRRASDGTTAAGAVESQVSLVIARQAASLLRARGVRVDVLPANVPPGYRAAALVSIHADGNDDPSISGFKIAASAEGATRASSALAVSLTGRYRAITGLALNPAITADMTRYYAFAARRFRNAIDPATPAVVLETGFLSNPADRRLLVDDPAVPARAVADGVLAYLASRPAARAPLPGANSDSS